MSPSAPPTLPVDENSTQADLAAAFEAASAAKERYKPQLAHMPLIVGVCGAPGSGKTTQAKVIAEVFASVSLNVDDLIREDLARPVGSRFAEFVYMGKTLGMLGEIQFFAMETLTLTDAVEKLSGKVFQETICAFDGYPKTVRGLQYFEHFGYPFDLIIWLHTLPNMRNDLKQRLKSRGGAHDTDWEIDTRLEDWDSQPLLEYLKHHWATEEKNLTMVNGNFTLEAVTAEVKLAVRSFLQRHLGPERFKERMERLDRMRAAAARWDGR